MALLAKRPRFVRPHLRLVDEFSRANNPVLFHGRPGLILVCTADHHGDRLAQPDVAVIDSPSPALLHVGRPLEHVNGSVPFIVQQILNAVVPHEAGRFEFPFLVAALEVLFRIKSDVVVAEGQGITEVEFALKEGVFEEFVHVHVEPSQMTPPLAAVKTGMSHGDLPQSVEVLEHAVAGRPVAQLAPFPLIPCSFQAVEELLCICSCFLLLPVERRCVTVGRCFVSFNGEHHLETHHADGFVSPVSRADGDKVHLVRRRFAWVVRHFTGQVAFIRKRKSGRKTRQHGCLQEALT